MLSIKRSIEETIAKVKDLLSEAGEKRPMFVDPKTGRMTSVDPSLTSAQKRATGAARKAAKAAEGAASPEQAVQRAQQSAMSYASRLDGTNKINADEIVKSTMTKGYAGAVDATFIDDLDARWSKTGERTPSSPRFLMYDYIIQMLAYAYNVPDGQMVTVGDQEFKVTPGMKKNIYEGLLKMFEIQDSKRRWKWFIFGSNVPGVSKVPSKYRPKISVKLDGTLDFTEVDNRAEYLSHWLKAGRLLRMMGRIGFYDKGFAYVLTALRMKYIELQRDKNKPRNIAASKNDMLIPDDEYEQKKLDDLMNDPAMVGGRDQLGDRVDQSFDLRYVGTKDDGENPGHNSVKRFVNALKVDDSNEGQSMAEFVAHGLLNFATTHLSDRKPHIVDLLNGFVSGEPQNLSDIANPEYAEMYPYANKFFSGKPRSYPYTYLGDAYKNEFRAEVERLQAKYIKDIDPDTKPSPVNDKLQLRQKPPEEKVGYDDYAGSGKDFDWSSESYQSLEETNGLDVDLHKVAADMLVAMDKLFLSGN